LVTLCFLIVGALLWRIRRSLWPVQLLTNVFDRLEREDYQHITPIPIAEFDRIGWRFNQLAQSLH
jgi:HAMP domain-containing protein